MNYLLKSHLATVRWCRKQKPRLRVPLGGSGGGDAGLAAELVRAGVDASSSASLTETAAALADLALKHRLPSVFGAKENVHAGGLISYAPDA